MAMDLGTVDHLLTTTRSVRKRLDFARPVEPAVIERCLEIAFQSPTGSNQQGWSAIVVTDPAKRKAIADRYLTSFRDYLANPPMPPSYGSGDIRFEQLPRVVDSANFLAENMHRAPVFVIFCIDGRVEQGGVLMQASLYGSVLPAAWSFMLAARARGLGSAWTTLHLTYEKEIAALLGIPATVTQTVLLPVAYYTGDDFKPAKRIPAREITHWDSWGSKR
jgi:nitroreductase